MEAAAIPTDARAPYGASHQGRGDAIRSDRRRHGSASRAPSQTTSSPLVADGANPVAAAPKAPLGDVADAEPQKQGKPTSRRDGLALFRPTRRHASSKC